MGEKPFSQTVVNKNVTLRGRNLEQDLVHKEDLPAKVQPGKERKEEGDRTEGGWRTERGWRAERGEACICWQYYTGQNILIVIIH